MDKKKSFGEELLEIRTFIEYGMFMPEMITRLSPFGFDPKEMIRGRDLLDATHLEQERYNKYAQKSILTCDNFSIKFNEIYEEFAKHRGRAKVAFRNNEYILNDYLAVNKLQSVKYIDWIAAAKRFYRNALGSREVIFAFYKVLVSEDDLRKTLSDIDELDRLRIKQEFEKGQSKIHTEIRNKKFSELKEWYNEALSIARIALKDVPHLLEALGIEKEIRN